MSRRNNMIKMTLAIGLVAVIGVGATLAYLTDTTDKVKNIFVIGNDIEIDLLETKYGEEEKTVVNGEFNENIYDGLLPSDKVTKDPTVKVHKDSSDCYVFMKVSGIDALEAVDTNVDGDGDFVVTGYDNEQWERVSPTDGNGEDGIYIYIGEYANENKVIPKQENDVELKELFENVKYLEAADGTTPEGGLPSIEVEACAIQAKGLDYENALEQVCNEVWK
ncbi:MAG TPA: hypothetical protein IAC62_02470 [Candidatus Pelethocola excrementipullorum]|nr:hypothetical protein [Candidatus Pelethocola excrementipullorum]